MTGSSSAVVTFRGKSSGIVARLLGDFPIKAEDGFAIVGNGGHECNGFTTLQEIAPTVKGSRGGWGWFQWTGPRRKAFETYCRRNKLDPASDEANYAWLFLELKGSEAKAIPAVLDADGLRTKVEAFERSFLRAGVKHYDSRLQWARIAEAQWAIDGQAPAPTPVERKREILADEAKATDTRAASAGKKAAGAGTGGLVSTGTGTVDASFNLADLLLIGVGVAIVGVAIWLGLRALKEVRTASRLRLVNLQIGGQ